MSREVHVRFREGLGVRSPRATRLVILSHGKANEALAWTEAAMNRLKLTLNTTKTCVRDARKETFDFLGYTFGWQMVYTPQGVWGMDARPSQKSIRRLKRKLHEVLRPWNVGPWEAVAGRVNCMLIGWSTYFAYGTVYPTYRAVDNHLYDRVRHFLRRRHKVASGGTKLLPTGKHLKAWGIVRLLDLLRGRRPACALG